MLGEQGLSFWRTFTFKEGVIILLFIFSVNFIFLPLNTSRLVILFCVFALLIQKEKLVLNIDIRIFYGFITLVLYGLYTAVITLINGGTNLANLANILISIFQIAIGSYLLTTFFIKKTLDQFLFLLLVIFGLQGILIFINFLIPQYREFMFVIMPPGGNITEDNFTSAFRTRGLMQSSGATVSALLAIGLLVAAYFLASFRLNKFDRKVIILSAIFISIGILFTGRTGLIVIPFAIVLYYILLVINKRFHFKTLLPLVWVPIILVSFYLQLKFIYGSVSPGNLILINLWEKWVFDQLIANFDQNAQTTTALEKLSSYLFIPDDDLHLLFGDPSSWGIIRTDLGYIRMIYSTGVIGSLLFYAGYLQLILFAFWNAVSSSQRIFLFVLTLWLLLIEYKEPMFLHYYFTSLIILMAFFSINVPPKDQVGKVFMKI